MTLREELEALEARAAATAIGDSPLWAELASLCRRAVEEADTWNSLHTGSLRDLSRLRAEVEHLKISAGSWADGCRLAEDEADALRASEQRARELLRETVTRLWAVYKNTSYAIGIEELTAWESYLSLAYLSPTGNGE